MGEPKICIWTVTGKWNIGELGVAEECANVLEVLHIMSGEMWWSKQGGEISSMALTHI